MIEIYEDEAELNPSTEPHFSDLVAARLSRRTLLTGSAAAMAGFLTSGLAGAPAYAAPRSGNGRSKAKARDLLGFTAIPLSYADEVAVPPGYAAQVFIPWGTPILSSYPAFRSGANTADEQAQQTGMDHDGMHYFPLSNGPAGSRRGLIAVNHENTNEGYLHTGTVRAPEKSAYTAEMVRKSQNAHGVAVVEVERGRDGQWRVVRSSRNRRITANTPMSFSGPAAGHRLVRTAADPAGRRPLGTINNCAHGATPWGTYLTCEENFNGYFRVDPGGYDAEHAALNTRYGVGGDRKNWATNDPRFVVTADNPNEPNRFGWVVEIDPFNPGSTPVKRTALGRTKHESAYVHVSKGGRVVVYMGDDQANEYLYKFVSAGNWKSLRARRRSPLDEGTLYVAKFHSDGRGEWLPLVHGSGALTAANGFSDQGDVLVKTRLAATALGATPMDRPEWTAVDGNTGAAYLTLTNNSGRTTPNAPNPRTPNKWGQIVRWAEAGGDHAARSFRWDLFLLAGQGQSSGDGSTIQDEDAFGSPDGLWIDPDGRTWIQTDGSQPRGANDQMLAANPYVRDAQGAPEIRRFFTGVVECEVTGVVTTPDQRTMFVNVQHPGDDGGSTWPRQDGITTPRSATVIITKNDGGVIGT